VCVAIGKYLPRAFHGECLPRNTSPCRRLRTCCIKTRLLTQGSAFQGARPRRRGDRTVVRFAAVHLLRCSGAFAALHMSLPGTFLPCQPRRAMSVTGGRPADRCSMRVHRILTHIGPRGAAGEPHGHPSIGDLDALTDCAALTIANCPSKKPTAAIFWIPHSGARVAGKLQSAESATGQLAYAALRSRAGRVVAAVRRSTRSGSVVGRG
jgi:hypothetical protein